MTLQAQIMCQNCTYVVDQLDSSRRGMRLQKRRKCQQESIRRLEELPSDAVVPTSEPRQWDRDTQTDSPLRTNRSQQTDCDPLIMKYRIYVRSCIKQKKN